MDRLMRELVQETDIEDISDGYRAVAEIVGVEKFAELAEYAQGDDLYFPKLESIVIPARNRRIKNEWNGYNVKELADKYGLTTGHVRRILKDEPIYGQISLFDLEEDM